MQRLTPYDWQEHDIRRIQEAGYVGLLNVQPGGGKTLVATEAILRSDAEVVLIIAPKSTHRSAWAETLKSQSGIDLRKIGGGNAKEKDALSDMILRVPGWYITTPQWFTRADITNWEVDALITDECHMLTAPGKSGQEKWSGTEEGDQKGSIVPRTVYRLALSGTPARNHFVRMWAIMRHLWPDRWDVARPSLYGWRAEHMLFMKTFAGLNKKGKPKFVRQYLRERNPGALIAQAPLVIQHFRREECCKWHPEGFLSLSEPQILRREVELSAKQRKHIKELEKQALTWLEDEPLMVELPMTLQQRIRQMCLGAPVFGEDDKVDFEYNCESPGADELLEILETLEEGEPVVVFMESQRFARALTERLNKAGYSAFEFSGQSKNREKNLASFGREDGHQICVGVISAFGTGTDGVQKVCNTEVWMEWSVDQVNNIQTEARTDRMGAKKQVQRYQIVDADGYALGRYSKQLQAELELRKSLRVDIEA